MPTPTPAAPSTLQAFQVELRTPHGTLLRYVAAPDLPTASARAAGALAGEEPGAEVVAIVHLGPALVR